MQHRIERLVRSSRLDEPRIAIVSMWDVENNAVRILAATLRKNGHKVVEVYFKDWISNDLDPASDQLSVYSPASMRRTQLRAASVATAFS